MSTTRDIELEAESLLAQLINTKVTAIKYRMTANCTIVEITFGNKKKLTIEGRKFSDLEIKVT